MLNLNSGDTKFCVLKRGFFHSFLKFCHAIIPAAAISDRLTYQTADHLPVWAPYPANVDNCKNVHKEEFIARLQVGHSSHCNGCFHGILPLLICNAPSSEVTWLSVLLAYPRHARDICSAAVHLLIWISPYSATCTHKRRTIANVPSICMTNINSYYHIHSQHDVCMIDVYYNRVVFVC